MHWKSTVTPDRVLDRIPSSVAARSRAPAVPGDGYDRDVSDVPEFVPEPLSASDGSADAPYQPAGERIADQLRAAIFDGRLAPGARIRQEALGTAFGVSRIPVREALRSLEHEGLVTLVPHSGARVARLDYAELREIYLIREAIEPLAAAESARRLDDDQLRELRAMVEAFPRGGDDPGAWLEADRRFHLASYAAAGMPRLLRMIEDQWSATQHYRRAYLATLTAEDHRLVDLEHRLLLDALERRDPTDAEARQRSHIRRTRLRLDEHRELFAE